VAVVMFGVSVVQPFLPVAYSSLSTLNMEIVTFSKKDGNKLPIGTASYPRKL
jgi:hypothetical protein